MSDERLFIHVCAGCGAQMTHARPCAPGCGSIEAESIEVVEAAALARVERERDLAQASEGDLVEAVIEAHAQRDALRARLDEARQMILKVSSWQAAAEVEADALRAQVKALTEEQAVRAAWATYANASASAAPGPATAQAWKLSLRAALAAARDAAAAKAPDDPLR